MNTDNSRDEKGKRKMEKRKTPRGQFTRRAAQNRREIPACGRQASSRETRARKIRAEDDELPYNVA
jgi:hypothetical protein